jgi:hypothetical protein
MQTCKAVVGAVHKPTALDGVAEAVATPASEKPTAAVELRNAPAAIHAVARHVTDEPRPFAAEATRRPSDRDALIDRPPVLSM